MSIPRFFNFLIFIGCSALLITAIWIEPFSNMNPCPMCVMQRVVFGFIGALALIAALHNPGGFVFRGYTLGLFLAGIGGALIAGRQIWLQGLAADQVPACGPGLEYMIEVFPLMEVIEIALTGTGDCAEVQWRFLGLSIPGWSLVAFAGISLLALWMLIKGNRKKTMSDLD